MLQNPCKILGFKKNMVYKFPPGGRQTISSQWPKTLSHTMLIVYFSFSLCVNETPSF